MTSVPVRGFRPDVDALRALAVSAVILFHVGYLPNGYLGVDVFFVISGYLITGIIYRELAEGRFTVAGFYVRRIRRILPLTLVTSTAAFVIGTTTMLPDDMENLAESAIATSFFGNNVLQAITTRNYWDVVNEFKPLMHTWSLGIEEQYYVFYPLLCVAIARWRREWLLPTLGLLAAASLLSSFGPFRASDKFYLIHFRFYELAAGGIGAIALRDTVLVHRATPVFLAALVALMSTSVLSGQRALAPVVAVLLTVAILASANERSRLSALVLENRFLVGVGALSFSLYMWHQIVLAFTRYAFVPELRPIPLLFVLALTVALSVASYRLVERPFRDKRRVGNKRLLWSVGVVFVVLNAAAFATYFNAGVLRDVPELDISLQHASRGMHAAYNMRVRDYDRDFTSSTRTRVLVIGNSFARDWANVLLESRHAGAIELAYVETPDDRPGVQSRSAKADIVFYVNRPRPQRDDIVPTLGKTWGVGPKSFGVSNGIFYNHRGADYCAQRVRLDTTYMASSKRLRPQWGARFLDPIERVVDVEQTVPVFTPQCKFISHDGRHFTRAGAVYYAELFDGDLGAIFRNAGKADGTKPAGEGAALGISGR